MVFMRIIGSAKCIVCRTNPKVGRATALPAYYFPVLLIPPYDRVLVILEKVLAAKRLTKNQ